MNPKQIAWKCRRGMLELDLIFMKFFQEKFPSLSVREQQIFIQLLDEQDPTLASWLLGPEESTNSDFARLISQIKQHISNSR